MLVGEMLVIVGAAGTKVKAEVSEVAPPEVTTRTSPVAPAPTTAVIVLPSGEAVKLDAFTPPNDTPITPVRFVPEMVMLAPNPPLAGLILVKVGGGLSTANIVREVAVPAGVTTLISPPLIPDGTTAVICVALTTVKLLTGVVPMRTAVAPVKFVPVMVSVAPGSAESGVKLVIVGAGVGIITVKFDNDAPVPLGVTTVIAPVAAPDGTVAVICVAELTVNVAATPPKRTAVALVKFVPVIVIAAPASPESGEKLVIVGASTGGAFTVKLTLLLVPTAFTTVTATVPAASPLGTVAVICVRLTTVNELAFTPPKRTDVAPVKFVPVIVTFAPTFALAGVIPVSVGAASTVPLAS
jgi:hypothetical protein